MHVPPDQHQQLPVKTPAAAATPRRRLLLVDDHPIVSRALADLVNHEQDLEVCGIANDYASTLQKTGALQPDLLVLDITLHGRGGLELLKDIKAQHPKQVVLILSMHDESLYAARAVRAGASGYVMKQEATENLLTAIRRVLAGEIYLSPRMEKRMMQRFARGTTGPVLDPLDALTDRELEIFRMIGQGKGTREIAQMLCLSVKTIESHRSHIKDKLSLRSSSELVQHAIQMEQDASATTQTAA
jgi:DNA-binding NarL/FixJ family response regulator